MTDKEKHDFITASRKLKDVGLSHVITVTDQKDKEKAMNDALLKALLFWGEVECGNAGGGEKWQLKR